MDPKFYKDFKTSRGLTYHYYYRPSTPSTNPKPTLLFLHGFPTTSAHWSSPASFFAKQGYGVLVPDLLGYGGTDKPTDPSQYRLKSMADDIIDILSSENLLPASPSSPPRVISISHDWGSSLNSRLAVYHPAQFAAFAFLAVGYTPPVPRLDIDSLNRSSLEKHGYEKFGYWVWFEKDDAHLVIDEHLESFFTLVFTADGGMKNNWCPSGELEKWLVQNRKSEKLVISEEEKQYHIDTFSKHGLAAPLCWYKAAVRNLNTVDDEKVPQSAYQVTKPVFFAACLRDPACIAAENVSLVRALCPNATVKEFNAGHWIVQECGEEVNNELKKWLDGLEFGLGGGEEKKASRY